MPKLSAAQFEARRNEILKAAFTCLAKLGYARMTIRDIAKKAGASVGTFYLYFQDKDEVILALREQHEANLSANLPESGDGTGAIEFLDALFLFLLRSLDTAECEDTLRVDIQIWAEALQNDSLNELAVGVFKEKIRNFAGLVAKAQKEGKLDKTLKPEALARLFLAIITGLELQRALNPGYIYKDLIVPIRKLLR